MNFPRPTEHALLVGNKTPELEDRIVSSVMEVFTGYGSTTVRYPKLSKPIVEANSRLGKRATRYGRIPRLDAHSKKNGKTRLVILDVHAAVKRVLAEAAIWPLPDPAALHIARVVERALPDARQKISEVAIERMIDAVIETQDPMARVNGEIDADNAKARVRFMTDFGCHSADEVTTFAGSTARNRSQTASRWKAEGKVFAVPFQGLDRYPAFQFKDGRPTPVIAQILKTLPREMSPWEIAFWFVSTNGWLGGASPHECLDDSVGVIEAARLEGEAIIG